MLLCLVPTCRDDAPISSRSSLDHSTSLYKLECSLATTVCILSTDSVYSPPKDVMNMVMHFPVSSVA
jgi:hypothetical protein